MNRHNAYVQKEYGQMGAEKQTIRSSHKKNKQKQTYRA